MKKNFITLAILIIILIAIIWLSGRQMITVANFDECVKAGNPVMESYPRQCKHRNQNFVEDISNQNPTDNTPTEDTGNLPVASQAVLEVQKRVAQEQGVNENQVTIMSVEQRTWTDGCLGLGGPAESCLMALVDGFHVTVQAKGETYIYRTNTDGSAIRQEN